MVSNKGTRGLDKSTRATLSALDFALEQSEAALSRRADEFTVVEYCAGMNAKGIPLKRRSALDRLALLVQSGKLKKRVIIINSRPSNIYSKP